MGWNGLECGCRPTVLFSGVWMLVSGVEVVMIMMDQVQHEGPIRMDRLPRVFWRLERTGF